jgi:hypothetical protein
MRQPSSAVLVFSLLAMSCTAAPKERTFGEVEARDAGAGGGEQGGAAPGPSHDPAGPGAFIAPPSDASLTGDDDAGAAACGAETRKAETTPLDMVIMMDRSGSMIESVPGGVKWDLLVSALRSFVESPDSRGIGVGLQYFGLGTVGVLGLGMITCVAADYASPGVPVSVLPAAAPAIVASLTAQMPSGGTPTVPALQGAIQYARSWAGQHPTHKVIVVLATDGDPNDCSSTVAGVVAAANDGAMGSPGIPTYVIGVGSLLTNLDQVAAAGGTGKAFIVDTTQNVGVSFLQAMNTIRNAAALPCHYPIPAADGGPQDLDKLNVAYTPGDGPDAGRRSTILHAGDASKCDPASGGWYYDDPAAPKAIELCSASCDAVTNDPTGQVDVLVGCKTLVIPIH